ncbi:MAG: xylose isomerase, partial [Alphaproteobacteria bacterium]|nr:xylose isomerase [Alphaproteobacteria bacterium]
MTTRRDVMLGGAALAAASAMPAFAADRPKSPLGIAQTALGHYFRKQRGDAPGARGPADPIATVDYVRSLGAGGLQMVIPLDTDTRKLRKRLDHHGMFFEGDIRLLDKPGDDTAAFEKGLRLYKELGAPCVRTVCFVGRRYENFSTLQQYKDWKANALAVLDACVPIADRIGIPLAMENHKDRVVDEEVEVLKKYSSANFGALVDFGNNLSLCDDPMDVVTKLSPYVKSCHMKNMGVTNYADGFLMSEVLFEDGFMDIPAMWAVLKKANPKLLPMHELITRDPLMVPVLTDKYWV